jgi:antitoxin MazE
MLIQEDIKMRVSVKRWGNSASVRIPVEIMRAAHLVENQIVDMREESGRIIIEPIQQPEFDLESLIAGITSENLHGEADFGVPVGKEVW